MKSPQELPPRVGHDAVVPQPAPRPACRLPCPRHPPAPKVTLTHRDEERRERDGCKFCDVPALRKSQTCRRPSRPTTVCYPEVRRGSRLSAGNKQSGAAAGRGKGSVRRKRIRRMDKNHAVAPGGSVRACVVVVERLFSCAWWGEGTSTAVCRRGRVCGSWRRATEADGGWTATSRGPSVRLTRVPRGAAPCSCRLFPHKWKRARTLGRGDASSLAARD